MCTKPFAMHNTGPISKGTVVCGPFKRARLSQVRFAEGIMQGMSRMRGT